MTACIRQERNPREISEAYSPDTPFVEQNYQDVLSKLEREGVICARSKQGRRRLGTYPAHVFVKFPAGEHHGN